MSNYSKNGKITDDYKYTYDAAGNKIKVQRNKFNNEPSVIFDETEGLTNYKYDQLNQLTEVAKPNQTKLQKNTSTIRSVTE